MHVAFCFEVYQHYVQQRLAANVFRISGRHARPAPASPSVLPSPPLAQRWGSELGMATAPVPHDYVGDCTMLDAGWCARVNGFGIAHTMHEAG